MRPLKIKLYTHEINSTILFKISESVLKLLTMTVTKRLISLDVMRGFTVAAMILVNFPGSEQFSYAPLNHSKWNGLSPTDLIAPIFLFVVGVSIAFAYSKRLEMGLPKAEMYKKIIWRALKIYLVGLFLNLLPDFNFAELRYTGTLPRIALVFLFCAVLFLNTDWKKQAWIGLAILVAYWLAMLFIPTPGYDRPMLEPGVNLAAWIDTHFLPGTMWQKTWDPEGILSTFPSFVSGISGMLAGRMLLGNLEKRDKVIYLMIGGFTSVILGYLWNLHFPCNENIWSSSFVLITSGAGALFLGTFYYLIDILDFHKFTEGGLIFGANAIAVYFLADILALLFYGIKVGGAPLNDHFMSIFVGSGLSPQFWSMIYALLFVMVNFIPALILYRKKVFIKL
jgi:predicted acyltransferase